MLTYQCPFGTSILKAHTREAMAKRIDAHNAIYHGPFPLDVCPPRASAPAHAFTSAAPQILRVRTAR